MTVNVYIVVVWRGDVARSISSLMFWDRGVTQKILTVVVRRGDVARSTSSLMFWIVS